MKGVIQEAEIKNYGEKLKMHDRWKWRFKRDDNHRAIKFSILNACHFFRVWGYDLLWDNSFHEFFVKIDITIIINDDVYIYI